MSDPVRRLATMMVWLFLGACSWAPFDESLLGDEDDRDDGARDRDRDDPADDASDQTDDPDADDEDPLPADDGETDDDEDVLDEPDTDPMDESGELEPNDWIADAQLVHPHETVLAEWTPAGDDDWYAIELQAGDALDIATRADDGGCDFDSIFLVYDAAAQPATLVTTCEPGEDDPAGVCVDDDGDSRCAAATVEVPSTGTYFIRVLEWGDDDHAMYSIDFELVP